MFAAVGLAVRVSEVVHLTRSHHTISTGAAVCDLAYFMTWENSF